MNVDIITLVEQYGYAALFFTLWLGIVGLPIPDEVIVMTGGLVVSLGLLKPIPAFFVTYLGVVTGLMIGYGLGRYMGEPAVKWLSKKKSMDKYVKKSNRLVHKYGSYSLCISYFLPVVRHIVPYLVGAGRMSFARYCLCSFSAGFVWTLLFFTIGRSFGSYIESIGHTVQMYGYYTLPAIFVVAFLLWIVWRLKRKKQLNTT